LDTLTVAGRSERMSRIRSKNTKPELIVRRTLHRLGYRYRIHRKDLPGSPDLVFPRRKAVVFVHGCFWHAHRRCSVANMPKSRTSYWEAKFERNRAHDRAVRRVLRKGGWKVFVIWECETKDRQQLEVRLVSCLGPSAIVEVPRKHQDGR
jgi:DNA mismatch endonuclease (patch repair protein)